MKLCSSCFDQVLDFSDGSFFELVIENSSVMLDFLTELSAGINGKATEAILSEDDKPIDMSTHLEILLEYIDFQGNQKRFMAKLLHAMEKTALGAEYFQQTQQLVAGIEKFLNEIAYEDELDLRYEKLSVQTILKSVGIQVNIDYNKLIERLYAYMELVRRFLGDQLFVLVNLRSYVSEEDLKQFTSTVIEHGLHILLVDNYAYPVLDNEKRLLIDMDLCEI